MADKENKTVDFEKLKRTVRVGVRMMDNVIDATPYFLPENERMAKGERRLGLGVMGLADLLIYCEKTYGSPEGNELIDKVRSEEHTSELQSRPHLVCRLLLEKKKKRTKCSE